MQKCHYLIVNSSLNTVVVNVATVKDQISTTIDVIL